MRIAVMGAGGIGGYLGGRLAAAGEDVAFVARGAHLKALRRDGLRIESPFGDLHLPQVTATDDPAEIGPVNLVLFTVKLYDSETAAATAVPLVGPSTRVLTLQNGIGSLDILARYVPSRVFIEQLRDEGFAVAAASGHAVPEERRPRMMALWQSLPPETRSSMANDLGRGKRLELEWLSGRMHALGTTLGVPTPAHTAVYRALHLHACPS
jgi:ketopantoate reductase